MGVKILIVLLLLLAHLIADFWLQTDLMVKNKMKHLKKHMVHHLITTGLALTIIWGYHYHFTNIIGYLLFPIVFICGTHLIIDVLKLKLLDTIKTTDSNSLKKLWFFLSDQLLHIVMLLITSIIFFNMNASSWLDINGISGLGIINTSLFIVIIFILATSVSGHIIKLIVGALPSDFANFEGEFTYKNKLLDVNDRNKPGIESSFTEEYHYFTYSNPFDSRGRLLFRCIRKRK